jgi:FixJ family two-component response regulator
VEQLMAGGATDYLAKPIDVEMLLEIISATLQGASPDLVEPPRGR